MSELVEDFLVEVVSMVRAGDEEAQEGVFGRDVSGVTPGMVGYTHSVSIPSNSDELKGLGPSRPSFGRPPVPQAF